MARLVLLLPLLLAACGQTGPLYFEEQKPEPAPQQPGPAPSAEPEAESTPDRTPAGP